jgi:hypothetical protein
VCKFKLASQILEIPLPPRNCEKDIAISSGAKQLRMRKEMIAIDNLILAPTTKYERK